MNKFRLEEISDTLIHWVIQEDVAEILDELDLTDEEMHYFQIQKGDDYEYHELEPDDWMIV